MQNLPLKANIIPEVYSLGPSSLCKKTTLLWSFSLFVLLFWEGYCI